MIDFTKGASRDRIERDQAVALLKGGTLIVDERRRRPFYFDGRFLTARDLIREQNYFLARQADLGRATGTGVIAGLEVTKASSSNIRIASGNGITISGELVTLAANLDVNLTDVAASQELDASFGIAKIPAPPSRNRSGVFIVSLRPVEFTANPIASYPKSLTGTRSVEDGDVIEGVAVTLIPYADETSGAEISRQQARIARDVFLRRGTLQPSVNALPLAMISLSRGSLNWVDQFLVRREVGADHGDTLGFGFAPRALREAQLQQYRSHLQSVLQERRNQGFRFAAADYFYCLPPVGPMPAASFDGAQMTQVFLPPGIQVEVSVIPDDELRGLVEDALLLPPIDLTLRDQEQQSTSVLILAPVPRADFNQIEAGLLGAPGQPAVQPPKLLAGRIPLQVLNALQLQNLSLPLERRQVSFDERWRTAVARVQTRETDSGSAELWFVRRRNLAYRPDIAGTPARPANDDFSRETLMQQLVFQSGNIKPRYDAMKINPNFTTSGLATLVEALAQEKYKTRPIAFQIAFGLFEKQLQLTEAIARKVAAQLDDPKFGDGLQAMAGQPFLAVPANFALLVNYPRVVEFDRLLATLDAPKIAAASAKLVAAGANQPAVNQLIDSWLAGAAI